MYRVSCKKFIILSILCLCLTGCGKDSDKSNGVAFTCEDKSPHKHIFEYANAKEDVGYLTLCSKDAKTLYVGDNAFDIKEIEDMMYSTEGVLNYLMNLNKTYGVSYNILPYTEDLYRYDAGDTDIAYIDMQTWLLHAIDETGLGEMSFDIKDGDTILAKIVFNLSWEEVITDCEHNFEYCGLALSKFMVDNVTFIPSDNLSLYVDTLSGEKVHIVQEYENGTEKVYENPLEIKIYASAESRYEYYFE